MKLENSFSVRAPIDEVWAALLDVERAAPCLPGARLIDRAGEDAYEIAIDVDLGDAPVTFQGQVSIVTQDAGDRTAVLSVTADGDVEGSAEARLELTLVRQGDLTAGTVAADVSMTGEVAALDQHALVSLVERMIDDFARNLAALLGGGVATVNGADPASSTVGPAPFVAMPPVGPPVVVAAGLAAETREAEPAAVTGDAPAAAAEKPEEPPPAYARPSYGDGSWAGATRQAGATIERLRSPVGAMLVALVVVGGVLGRRRRSRRMSAAGVAAAEEAEAATAPGPAA